MGRVFSPFVIGRSFRILPQGHPAIEDERINLWMAPGAFGSGEHETTASCLEILEDLEGINRATILDLGSGTGILAIAALKLGARSAVCIDIDPAAVATCRLNSQLNGVDDDIDHVCGTLSDLPEATYDLVLANIYGDILINVAEELSQRVGSDAPLLLSGILYEYNFDVRQRYQQYGCHVVKNRMLDEFSTVLLQKGF
ncbi:50S ribosomal protein L11 methyltransferase [uncultured Desulfuromonas sp.]|uniref:50S ribosomal protein L11 methyltransferase n=1 Tax=uncultured Desulfuromonas sp. TaxID=181013 RepID=UPI002AABA66E|nr:50S ribosomal protein L11 methyltransferase [uncultured Desulfuromonas sp.]